MHAFFDKYGYTAEDFHSRAREELLKDIAQNLVYELVIDNPIKPTPSFVSRALPSTALSLSNILDLRLSYDQLDPFEKSYVRLKFKDRDDNPLSEFSYPEENFLVQADVVVERLCNDLDFGGFVLRILSKFCC